MNKSKTLVYLADLPEIEGLMMDVLSDIDQHKSNSLNEFQYT